MSKCIDYWNVTYFECFNINSNKSVEIKNIIQKSKVSKQQIFLIIQVSKILKYQNKTLAFKLIQHSSVETAKIVAMCWNVKTAKISIIRAFKHEILFVFWILHRKYKHFKYFSSCRNLKCFQIFSIIIPNIENIKSVNILHDFCSNIKYF